MAARGIGYPVHAQSGKDGKDCDETACAITTLESSSVSTSRNPEASATQPIPTPSSEEHRGGELVPAGNYPLAPFIGQAWQAGPSVRPDMLVGPSPDRCHCCGPTNVVGPWQLV